MHRQSPQLASDDGVTDIVDLLGRQFGASVDRTVIACYVRAAAHDLRGSICPEALPEMACRLAGHRLAEFTGQVRTDAPSPKAHARSRKRSERATW